MTPEKIIDIVCEKLELNQDELARNGSTKYFTGRAITYYFLRKYFGKELTLDKISKAIGLIDKKGNGCFVSVYYAIGIVKKNINHEIKDNKEFLECFKIVETEFNKELRKEEE